MTNLLVTMLDKSGIPAETFGDSTGKIQIEPLSGEVVTSCSERDRGRESRVRRRCRCRLDGVESRWCLSWRCSVIGAAGADTTLLGALKNGDATAVRSARQERGGDQQG